MPPSDRDDQRLTPASANHLLSDVVFYRCQYCQLWLVEPTRLHQGAFHARCGGPWRVVDQPLDRAVLLRFLTREMLAGGPRWERV